MTARMSRWLVLALLFAAGCAPVSSSFLTAEENGALTPAARVFQLQGEFNILLAQFERYAAQPFCLSDVEVGCADREVVVQAAALAGEAAEVLTGARQSARTGGGDLETAAAGARVGVAQLSRYLITQGITQ